MESRTEQSGGQHQRRHRCCVFFVAYRVARVGGMSGRGWGVDLCCLMLCVVGGNDGLQGCCVDTVVLHNSVQRVSRLSMDAMSKGGLGVGHKVAR